MLAVGRSAGVALVDAVKLSGPRGSHAPRVVSDRHLDWPCRRLSEPFRPGEDS